MFRISATVATDVEVPTFSVAITPTSLPRASAHSRWQPETPILILCGDRRPRYRNSSATAMATESCTP